MFCLRQLNVSEFAMLNHHQTNKHSDEDSKKSTDCSFSRGMTDDFEQFHPFRFVDFPLRDKSPNYLIDPFSMKASLASYASGIINHNPGN